MVNPKIYRYFRNLVLLIKSFTNQSPGNNSSSFLLFNAKVMPATSPTLSSKIIIFCEYTRYIAGISVHRHTLEVQ